MSGNQQMKIEFKSEGFRQILLGDGVKDVLYPVVKRIQENANSNANLPDESEGFSCKIWHGNDGGGRWIGSVSTTDHASMVAEAEDKALSRAVTG